MATIAETFQTALALHRAGQLQQAEQLYRQILQADTSHAEAHHLLGLLAHRAGRHDEALAAIQQAIALNPSAALFYFDLGAIYDGAD